jgi:STE24 endopeptidase
VSRILLLLVFLLWMSAPQPQAGGPAHQVPPLPPDIALRTAIFLGGYLLLVGGVRAWSHLLARRITRNNLSRSLRRFGRGLLAVRFFVPAWFAVGLFELGWADFVHHLGRRAWDPLQLPSVLLGTFPAFAAWAGLWWSQYPADHTLREQSLLDELEADLPVHAPPTFRTYFLSNLRLQLLFTAIPILAIIGMRDLIATVVRKWAGPAALTSEPVEFVTMLLSTGLVFVLAPEILRRVLQTQPLPDSPLRRRLEALCRRVGMRYRDILLWHTDNNMGNAAVMGIIPPVRYILLSDLLLERMDDEQIEAVFAHEVGHVVHRHMAWYVVVILIFMLLVVAVGQFVPDPPPAVPGIPQEITKNVLLPIAAFAGFLVYFGFLSRRFERQADVYAARIIERNAQERSGFRVQGSGVIEQPSAPSFPEPRTVNPEPSPAVTTHVGEYGATVFASALHRVALMNNIPIGPRRSPKRGLARRLGHLVDGVVDSLHNWLHGSIHHRMAYLRGLSTDPTATTRFDRFMIGLYCTLLFMLFACAAFVASSGGATGKQGPGGAPPVSPTLMPGKV